MTPVPCGFVSALSCNLEHKFELQSSIQICARDDIVQRTGSPDNQYLSARIPCKVLPYKREWKLDSSQRIMTKTKEELSPLNQNNKYQRGKRHLSPSLGKKFLYQGRYNRLANALQSWHAAYANRLRGNHAMISFQCGASKQMGRENEGVTSSLDGPPSTFIEAGRRLQNPTTDEQSSVSIFIQRIHNLSPFLP